MLVNIGCGDQGKPGWVNLDGARLPGVACVYDARTRLPFPDGSVRAIFTEHFLEHLDVAEAPEFLAECRRVLERGSVIRIVVPDAEAYVRGYCATGWGQLRRSTLLVSENPEGYETKMQVLNDHFRQGYQHKYSYDYETLEALLRRCGFSTVLRQEFGTSLMAELAIDSPMRAIESLYVEAMRDG